jgi:hypothetical protein
VSLIFFALHPVSTAAMYYPRVSLCPLEAITIPSTPARFGSTLGKQATFVSGRASFNIEPPQCKSRASLPFPRPELISFAIANEIEDPRRFYAPYAADKDAVQYKKESYKKVRRLRTRFHISAWGPRI